MDVGVVVPPADVVVVDDAVPAAVVGDDVEFLLLLPHAAANSANATTSATVVAVPERLIMTPDMLWTPPTMTGQPDDSAHHVTGVTAYVGANAHT
jgi:hypothetical protein